MAIGEETLTSRTARFERGDEFSEADINLLRVSLTTSGWLEANRKREVAIEAKMRATGTGANPYPEGAQVRLKSGGPVMTVEVIRPSEPLLVQVLWFNPVAGDVRRDAFHKDALDPIVTAPAPLPEQSKTWGSGLYGEITDAALDKVACEIYRAICEERTDRFQMPRWQALGPDARDIYRKVARAAWAAFLELHD